LDGVDAENLVKPIFEQSKKTSEVNNLENWFKEKCDRYPKTAELLKNRI
jgi:hypothetical protein